MTRAFIRPCLNPTRPVYWRRLALDAIAHGVPPPRGTRRAAGSLGGVPTVVIAAPGPIGSHRVLYLHGGGYQVGSPFSHRALLARLSRAAGAPVHAPCYRLAPEHPYPAAVDDAVAAFRALRSAGHPAQRIAVAGDSAGGGLALAVVLRLRAAGDELPGSVGLISPWVNLDCSLPSVRANAATDALLNPDWLARAAQDYRAGGDGPDLRPLEADLAGLPPVHVVAGAAELLVDEADQLVERARAAGVPVRYRRAAGMWHDYPTLAGLLAEADEALDELGDALRTDCSRHVLGAMAPR